MSDTSQDQLYQIILQATHAAHTMWLSVFQAQSIIRLNEAKRTDVEEYHQRRLG